MTFHEAFRIVVEEGGRARRAGWIEGVWAQFVPESGLLLCLQFGPTWNPYQIPYPDMAGTDWVVESPV